jgi:hypothetical protein
VGDVWGFDAERALQHVRRLCHPRGVGTPGEARAADYLMREFASQGLEVQRDPFRLSHFPTTIGSRIVFTICAALTICGALLVAGQPLLALLCWATAAYLVNAPWRVNYWLGGDWPPYGKSANVIARLPGVSAVAPARIIFMAHYDTKSQVMPTAIRVVLVTLVTCTCVFLSGVALLAAAGQIDARGFVLPWAPTIAVVVALACLVANMTGNRCPGALDNGSALGTLLELARSWRPKVEAPADVVWVATGAEEVNLNGAWHYLHQYGHQWNDKPTLLINLECVGAGPKLYFAGHPLAMELAARLAAEMGFAYAPLRVLGAGLDHQPFASRNLPSISVMGDVVRHSFRLHSPRDMDCYVEPAALARAGTFSSQLAWNWAATAGQGAIRSEAVVPA